MHEKAVDSKSELPTPDEPLANHGEVFTRPWVVVLILDLAGFGPTGTWRR